MTFYESVVLSPVAPDAQSLAREEAHLPRVAHSHHSSARSRASCVEPTTRTPGSSRSGRTMEGRSFLRRQRRMRRGATAARQRSSTETPALLAIEQNCVAAAATARFASSPLAPRATRATAKTRRPSRSISVRIVQSSSQTSRGASSLARQRARSARPSARAHAASPHASRAAASIATCDASVDLASTPVPSAISACAVAVFAPCAALTLATAAETTHLHVNKIDRKE